MKAYMLETDGSSYRWRRLGSDQWTDWMDEDKSHESIIADVMNQGGDRSHRIIFGKGFEGGYHDFIIIENGVVFIPPR